MQTNIFSKPFQCLKYTTYVVSVNQPVKSMKAKRSKMQANIYMYLETFFKIF